MIKDSKEYLFDYTPNNWISPEIINELSDFYSNHYGFWSEKSPLLPGKRIKLSSNKIKDWFNNELSELWTVRNDDCLIGYAIALRGVSGSKERIIWVTQFVIHTDYRNSGIGKRLLFSIWGFSSFFAWGLVTANPFAVRALEKATRRRCESHRIKKNTQQLMNFGISNVSYIKKGIEHCINENTSKLNTDFFVNHSELDGMILATSTIEKPWLLGNIEEGWEWFAFTFKDQTQFELSPIEIGTMLNDSDSIAHEAYNRMQMDNPAHKWAEYTGIEVDYILKQFELTKESKILDFGCGTGRHTLELSRRGYTVTGIDYAKTLIDIAQEKANQQTLNPTFIWGDVSNPCFSSDIQYDLILCLYDVIGSYADNSKNIQILENISKSLKKGGYVILSVMNLHLTEKNAKNKFVLSKSSKELLDLTASDTMETSGGIFNPDYYLMDTETKIIYRRELFSFKNGCPKELIVRDRRFYIDEIVEMCENAKLEVNNKRFVGAGWQKEYDSTHDRAKEILLICRKK